KLLQREKLAVLPPALELLRKVEVGLAAVWGMSRESDVRARVGSLNAEITKVNSRVAEGPPTRLAPLDVDQIVDEWRARRARPGWARLHVYFGGPYVVARYSVIALASASLRGAPKTLIILVTTAPHCFASPPGCITM